MIALLFIFGLAATFMVGGVMGSLRLRTHSVATRRRLSGLRRAYVAPMGYMTAVNRKGPDDVSSRYTLKALVTSLLLLVLLSVILIGVLNAVMH